MFKMNDFKIILKLCDVILKSIKHFFNKIEV